MAKTKEAYYFPHDMNAIQDPKLMTLLSECGLFGIGAFWVLIEILHQQQCGGIGVPQARSYLSFYGKQGAWDQTILDKCEKVLFETGLLFEKDGIVYSQRVINNIERRAELSEVGRQNANKRWGVNATAMPLHSKPNAIKERKVKEKKERSLSFNFDEIWEKYPNRDGKKLAIGYFKKSVKTLDDWNNINKALENYKSSDNVLKGFIKNGSTWFNNWQDWINFNGKPKIKEEEFVI